MSDTIKKSEYSCLCYFIMLSMFWGTTVFSLLQMVRQDSWISILLSAIVNFIPLFIYYLLLNHNPKNNIVANINDGFGKLGKIINLIFIAFCLFTATLVLWNLTNFIASQYLYQTPRLAIAILFMATCFYIVYKGLTAISRCGTIFFIFNIVLFLLAVFSLISDFKIGGIFPIFEYGFVPIIKGTYVNISLNIFPLFFLLIIPKDNIENNKKLIKSFIKTYLVSYITTFLVITVTISTLGINMARLYEYPEYHILKLINIANFFQRVESVLSLQLISVFMMAISFYLYYLKTAFMQTFNIKKFELIIMLGFSIIMVILSRIIFRDDTLAQNFIWHIYPILSGIILFALPIIILVVLKIKKKFN